MCGADCRQFVVGLRGRAGIFLIQNFLAVSNWSQQAPRNRFAHVYKESGGMVQHLLKLSLGGVFAVERNRS
jgi:hypothetical protein